jgi:uncharacterized Zn finger protein (UPF0148 family)
MLRSCPKCSTLAYDHTSIFCHVCGTQLAVHTPKKKQGGPENSGITILSQKSIPAGNVPQVPPKTDPVQRVRPIHICAQCGGPVIDKTRIFCTDCEGRIQDAVYGEPALIMGGEPGIITSEVYQNPETRNESESVLVAENSVQSKSHEWILIAIFVGIALLYFILTLFILL